MPSEALWLHGGEEHDFSSAPSQNMKNEGLEKSGKQLVPEKQIFWERFEVISRDAEMCMQLFSRRAAGIFGRQSLPAGSWSRGSPGEQAFAKASKGSSCQN